MRLSNISYKNFHSTQEAYICSIHIFKTQQHDGKNFHTPQIFTVTSDSNSGGRKQWNDHNV